MLLRRCHLGAQPDLQHLFAPHDERAVHADSVLRELYCSRAQERRWRFMRAGREGDYHGQAVHPRHLSKYERYVLKCGPSTAFAVDR